MTKFEKVKYYYDHKLWTINQVRNAVIKNWITIREFEQITNTFYN